MDARVLRHVADLGLAESALCAPAASFAGVEQYPDLAMKASVLCVRLTKNHALPDGNKRTAFLCTVEFAERNGYRWIPPSGDMPGGEETIFLTAPLRRRRRASGRTTRRSGRHGRSGCSTASPTSADDPTRPQERCPNRRLGWIRSDRPGHEPSPATRQGQRSSFPCLGSTQLDASTPSVLGSKHHPR